MVRTSQHRSHVVTGASQLQELKHLNATSLQIRKRTKKKERKKGGGGGGDMNNNNNDRRRRRGRDMNNNNNDNNLIRVKDLKRKKKVEHTTNNRNYQRVWQTALSSSTSRPSQPPSRALPEKNVQNVCHRSLETFLRSHSTKLTL